MLRTTLPVSRSTYLPNALDQRVSSILEDAEMAAALQAGDDVVLVSIPDWLAHDLPEPEKQALTSCVGCTMKIERVDQHGYYWIGFGATIDVGDDAQYSGHSFCVPAAIDQISFNVTQERRAQVCSQGPGRVSVSQDLLSESMRHLRDFYYGALEPAEFDRWLCQEARLQDVVGDEAFSELINTDYSDRDEIDSARHVVERVYRERLNGDLARDRTRETLEGMLMGTMSLQAGCVTLWELRLDGAQFIPAFFAGYASELERTADEDFYRERILRDAREFLHDVEPDAQ